MDRLLERPMPSPAGLVVWNGEDLFHSHRIEPGLGVTNRD
jgi:hypothetical protein